MWYVYILLCNDGSLYTGISTDPQKRFLKHLSGKGSKYTRSHSPKEIVYTEALLSRSDALKREFEIKQMKKEDKMNLYTSLTTAKR